MKKLSKMFMNGYKKTGCLRDENIWIKREKHYRQKMSHKIQLSMSILKSLWEHECWEQTFQNSQTMIAHTPLNK